ncbi:hypothetical protein HZA85_04295 [Candidatus Uhrbacteria bacterium]|nr:hypothetical protein [Candidatus Uhrbacteria bacterium]
MNRILETTKFVVDHADHVRINHDRLIEFAGTFDHGSATHWLQAAPFDFSHFSDEEKLHFLFLFNVLSFCYWGEPKWTVHYQNKKYDGAWGMILALGRAIEEEGDLLNFDTCSRLPKETFASVLRGDGEIPLFEERWSIVQEVGKIMVEQFDGKVSILLARADGDAHILLDLIDKAFPSFFDASIYKNQTIFFQKRAQLFVADVYQIFDGKSFGALQKVDQITACADYKLPQILRKFDILQYTKALSQKIDSQQELPHGSVEEIEIRAHTIWAVEQLTNEIKKRLPHIQAFQVNDHLWLATQEKFSIDKPYHRTRTTAY